MLPVDFSTVSLAQQVAVTRTWLVALDDLPNAVVFVKDEHGRYLFANRTLALRLGLKEAGELIGKTAAEVFPEPLGERYAKQDLEVLTGRDLFGQLELHLYPNREPGWCLTSKHVIRDTAGRSVGLAGVSRDLNLQAGAAPRLAVALEAIRERHAEPLRITDLAGLAGMSVKTFERHSKALLGLSPAQLLMRARIEAALHLLSGTTFPVTRVANECGYFDHSAFSRAFRTAVGVTPSEYRRMARSGQEGF